MVTQLAHVVFYKKVKREEICLVSAVTGDHEGRGIYSGLLLILWRTAGALAEVPSRWRVRGRSGPANKLE